jgi:transcriptional regulator with XRE-family HTH domain
MTPNGVAKELGFPSSSVTQWKKGSTPRPAALRKIADFFGVSVDDFLMGEETKKEPVPISENELDLRLIELLTALTPDEMRQVDAFVQGLLASR